MKTVEGAPVTMVTIDKGFHVSQDDNQDILFDLDISRLVPGRYTLSPVFYEVNEYGGNNNLDGLKDSYCFEIAPSDSFNNNMVWQSRYWGHFYNDPMIIKK